MRFWLGTHEPSWLETAGVDLFVSRRRLARRRRLPRAMAPWALDSGGFTELAMHGRWTVTPRQYAAEVRRYQAEIGMMEFAAPQDWMCEPVMLAKTGFDVAEHQRRTIDNLLELRDLAPEVPWMPVLQGWSPPEYWRHLEQYAAAGVDLRDEILVGVGSVCRRQGLVSAHLIFSTLCAAGLRLHGFGVKKTGLKACRDLLASADSLAWSYAARRSPSLGGHPHKNCANCLEFALSWRSELVVDEQRFCEVAA